MLGFNCVAQFSFLSDDLVGLSRPRDSSIVDYLKSFLSRIINLLCSCAVIKLKAPTHLNGSPDKHATLKDEATMLAICHYLSVIVSRFYPNPKSEHFEKWQNNIRTKALKWRKLSISL